MDTSLDPHYITGFVDGEGSFHVAIYKDPRMKAGVKFIPEFHVSQRFTSKVVLDDLAEYFGCGYVKENHTTRMNDTTYVYVVRKRSDLLDKIIPFFEKFKFRTEKLSDFELFAQIVRKMDKGEHRTSSGAKKILDLAYQMNRGGRYRRTKHTIF